MEPHHSYTYYRPYSNTRILCLSATYHDQHLGYQSQTAWTSSVQQLVITKSTCTCAGKTWKSIRYKRVLLLTKTTTTLVIIPWKFSERSSSWTKNLFSFLKPWWHYAHLSERKKQRVLLLVAKQLQVLICFGIILVWDKSNESYKNPWGCFLLLFCQKDRIASILYNIWKITPSFLYSHFHIKVSLFDPLWLSGGKETSTDSTLNQDYSLCNTAYCWILIYDTLFLFRRLHGFSLPSRQPLAPIHFEFI